MLLAVAALSLLAVSGSVQPARPGTAVIHANKAKPVKGAGANSTAVAPPASTVTRFRCMDLPISSQVISPASCWQTGPISMLITGSSPTQPGAGVVAVVRGQGEQVTSIPGAGELTVKKSTSVGACVETRNGLFYSVVLATGSVSRRATSSCSMGSAADPGSSQNGVRLSDNQVSLAKTTSAVLVPPPVTASYYEYLSYATDCGSGATTGCMMYLQGQSTITPETGGVLILDFGSQCSSGSTYGIQMFGSTTCRPDGTVHQLVQEWINGYESDHLAESPDFTVGVGTSNSYTAADPPTYQPANLQTSGANWYQDVVGSSYITGPAPVTVWGASDMEESSGGDWYDGSDTISWVTGYAGAAFHEAPSSECSLTQTGFLADYGDDNSGGLAAADWTINQVYDVAQGIIGTCAVPEIYYSGNAPEWLALSQWAQTNGYLPMQFTAVMVEPGGSSQCPPPDGSTLMSASCAWTQLETATGQSPAIPGITQIATALQAPGPQVSSVSPAYAPEESSTPITISGSGFLGAQSVYFGSQSVTVTASEVNSTGTQITIDSPAESASVVDVVVVTSLGSSAVEADDEFQYDAPACTAITVTLAAPSASPGFNDLVTASAICPVGAATEYSYFIRAGDSGNWTLEAAYIGPTWTWNTSSLSDGDYQVLVWAADGPYAGPQVQQLASLTLTPQPACTGVAVGAIPSTVMTGNSVVVTATPSCPTGSLPEYSYFVRQASAPTWTLESAWSGPTWTWSTTGLSAGNYQVLVWVSDGPVYSPQAETSVPVTIEAIAPCTSDSVSVTSQVLHGQVADISATSTCPSGTTPLYSYFLRADGAPAWTLEAAWTGSTWSLNTSDLAAGDYQVLAWVSDGPVYTPQAEAVAVFTVEQLTACSSVSLTAPSTVTEGLPVGVSASATCPTGAQIEYSFFARADGASTWTLEAAWIGPNWTWSTVGLSDGAYQLLVWASDGPVYTPQAESTATVAVYTQQPCTAVSVTATPSSLAAGQSVTVAATGSCPADTSPLYTYFTGPSAAGPFTLRAAWIGPDWTWTTTGLTNGTYYVVVWVSGAQYNGPQAQGVATITVNTPTACSGVSATTNPSSVTAGQTVTVSATSTCPVDTTPLYSYFTGPSPTGPWTLQSAWSGNSWSWSTVGLPSGTNYVTVWVSDGPYSGPQAQTQVSITVTAIAACTAVGLTAPATALRGQAVDVIASATCPSGAAVEYSYFARADGAPTWTLEAAWVGPTWTWSTVGLPDGGYQILTWASDGPVYAPQAEAVADIVVYTQLPCTSLSVAITPSTLAPGQPASVAATATCPGGTVPLYSYFTGPTSTGPFTLQAAWIGSTWPWPTSGLADGSYYVVVWVSGAQYDGPEAQALGSIEVSTPAPCTGLVASPNPTSVTAGQSVTVTPSPTCPGSTTPLYSYFLSTSAGGPYTLQAAWVSGSWTWATGDLPAGTYYVIVWVSDGPYNAGQVQALTRFQVTG